MYKRLQFFCVQFIGPNTVLTSFTQEPRGVHNYSSIPEQTLRYLPDRVYHVSIYTRWVISSLRFTGGYGGYILTPGVDTCWGLIERFFKVALNDTQIFGWGKHVWYNTPTKLYPKNQNFIGGRHRVSQCAFLRS